MQRILLLAGIATVLAGPALAQRMDASAGSQAGASAVAIAGGGGSGDFRGGYHVRSAPPVSGSILAAPCTTAAQGGGSGMGFGIIIGGAWQDADCNRRANAAALLALGERDAALRLMAQDPSVARALAPEPMAAAPAPQPVAAPAPAPDTLLRFTSAPAPRARPQRYRPCRWVGSTCQ